MTIAEALAFNGVVFLVASLLIAFSNERGDRTRSIIGWSVFAASCVLFISATWAAVLL